MTWPWVALILAGSVGGAVLGVTLWLIYRKGRSRSDKQEDANGDP